MGDDSEAGTVGVWGELDTLVDEVQRARAAVAAAQAAEAALLARAVELVEARTAERRARGVRFGNDLPLREVSAELGTAMRVGDRTVQRRIDDAHTLVTRFAATFQAWQAGRVDRQHVTTIVDEGIVLVDERARREYETLVLAVAEIETAGRMREICRVIAARIDPAASALRRATALHSRDVRIIDLDDGMARLLADLPAPLAYAIHDQLTHYARDITHAERAERAAAEATAAADSAAAADVAAEATAGDPDARDSDTDDVHVRTMAEIRADVLADLLLTATTPTGHTGQGGNALTGIHATIAITIPVTTAAGLDHDPALLTGYGPIDTTLARTLTAHAPAWLRVLVDPHTGTPLAVDRYRPSAALERFIDIRDERCRFPGCTMTPRRCDADHTIAAALGGPTSPDNLADLCRRHHTLKHCSPWHVRQLPTGQMEWTSPTGRTCIDNLPATLRFTPPRENATTENEDDDGEPPPF